MAATRVHHLVADGLADPNHAEGSVVELVVELGAAEAHPGSDGWRHPPLKSHGL
jgi:hypothetical protein